MFSFLPTTVIAAADSNQELPRCIGGGGQTAYQDVSRPPDETDKCHLVISRCKSQPGSSGSWLAWTCCRRYQLTYDTRDSCQRIERSRCSRGAARLKLVQHCSRKASSISNIWMLLSFICALGDYNCCCKWDYVYNSWDFLCLHKCIWKAVLLKKRERNVVYLMSTNMNLHLRG